MDVSMSDQCKESKVEIILKTVDLLPEPQSNDDKSLGEIATPDERLEQSEALQEARYSDDIGIVVDGSAQLQNEGSTIPEADRPPDNLSTMKDPEIRDLKEEATSAEFETMHSPNHEASFVAEEVAAPEEGQAGAVVKEVAVLVDGQSEAIAEEVNASVDMQSESVAEALMVLGEEQLRAVAEEAPIEGQSEAMAEKVAASVSRLSESVAEDSIVSGEGHSIAVAKEVAAPEEEQARAVDEEVNESKEGNADSAVDEVAASDERLGEGLAEREEFSFLKEAVNQTDSNELFSDTTADIPDSSITELTSIAGQSSSQSRPESPVVQTQRPPAVITSYTVTSASIHDSREFPSPPSVKQAEGKATLPFRGAEKEGSSPSILPGVLQAAKSNANFSLVSPRDLAEGSRVKMHLPEAALPFAGGSSNTSFPETVSSTRGSFTAPGDDLRVQAVVLSRAISPERVQAVVLSRAISPERRPMQLSTAGYPEHLESDLPEGSLNSGVRQRVKPYDSAAAFLSGLDPQSMPSEALGSPKGAKVMMPKRRNPVDECLANFSMSRAIDKHVKQRHEWYDNQLTDMYQVRDRLKQAQAACFTSADDMSNAAVMTFRPGHYSDSSSRPGTGVMRTRGLVRPDSGDGRHEAMTGMCTHSGLASNIQGAYLTLPEYSFSGSRPLKAMPERGVQFEKYGQRDEPVSSVQQFYLRPDRATLISMQQKEAATKRQHPKDLEPEVEQIPPAPARMLPNGIPVSRLEHRRSAQELTRSKMDPRVSSRKDKSSQSVASELSLFNRRETVNAVPPVLPEVRSSVYLSAQNSSGLVNPQKSNLNLDLASASTLKQIETANDTQEPLLDDDFCSTMKSHFNQMAENQTIKLQSKLNTGLPAILKQFGVRYIGRESSRRKAR